ncbi:MAG: hypothetical protein SFZ02_00955 [bacterium]|nr:hypothetical protein [bacterium]
MKTKKYKISSPRTNFFKRPKLIIEEGKHTISIGIWHFLGGILLFCTSIYKILEKDTNPVSFIIIWIWLYIIIELLAMVIFYYLKRQYSYKDIKSQDSHLVP